MMESCSLWLLLVALFSLIDVATAYCQHTEKHGSTFLVAIKNNESGLEIYTRFPENHGSKGSESLSELESQMHFIPGHNLSSACGDQYFRCQELLVETFFLQNMNREINVVFVPLETGILLLTFSSWCDSYSVTVEWNIIFSFNCRPVAFYEIHSKFYMICINYHGCFVMYEVELRLNSSGIENATIMGPLTSTCTYKVMINTSNSSSWSKFIILHVENKVYIAVGNAIIVMDVLDPAHAQTQCFELHDCSQIYNLVPTKGVEDLPLLVAYCTDRYTYFDPVYEDWTNEHLFSNDGEPYICPDNNYNATLVTNSEGNFLSFSVRDSSSKRVTNVNISSGLCFESQNRTYFAYSDQQHNSIFVYDFTTQNHYPVSPYDCLTQPDCPQLLLLHNQYLIIGDANHDLVLDSKTNFSLLINIFSGMVDILVILHSNIYSAITPSPPIIHSTTSAKVPSTPVHSIITPTVSPDVPTAVSPVHNNLVGIISTAVIGFFVIIVILVTIGFSIRHWRRKRGKSAYRIPRLRLTTNHRRRPLLLAKSAKEEEEEEGEESESYELESMVEPRHFGKEWRWTTEV